MIETTVTTTDDNGVETEVSTKVAILALLGIPMLLVLIVLAGIPLSLLSAWVAQKLYIWFLLPLHAPVLNLWHIWGIIMLVNLLTANYASATTDNKSSVAKYAGYVIGRIIGPLAVLAVAYLIKGHIGY